MINTLPVSPRALRVLVVDDHRDTVDSLALLLRLRGYHVGTAYDGTLALRLFPGFRPDVALIDLAMPGMSGYELIQRMRDLAGPIPPVFVALTGFADHYHRRTALESGFQHFFSKPVAFDQLETLLTNITQQPRRLKLYVAGMGGRAMQAVANLRGLCSEAPEHFQVEVIDVQERPEVAERDRIIQTPCLVDESGSLPHRVIGDLGDRERVLGGLGLRPTTSDTHPNQSRFTHPVRHRKRTASRTPPLPARPARNSLCNL